MATAIKARKIFRSADQWRAIMSRYAASGLTQEQFCAREDLAISTFCSWRARVSLNGGAADGESALDNDFVDVTPPLAQSVFDMELALPGGVVLRMRTR